jgi:hypothetical protein
MMMKKTKLSRLYLLLVALIVVASSFTAYHKFYVSIYQIHYAPEKKMLQITSRIFIDDLNRALAASAKTQTFFGEKEQSEADIIAFKAYIKKNLHIKVDGKNRDVNYLSSELEGNIVISYFNVRDVTKVRTLEIKNTVLTDVIEEQQNIIQLSVNKEKRNMLLTASRSVDNVTF